VEELEEEKELAGTKMVLSFSGARKLSRLLSSPV
jgi:hypothetical protein